MDLELDLHDILDAEKVVTSDSFTQLLLSKTTSFKAAAFINFHYFLLIVVLLHLFYQIMFVK